MTMPAPDQEKPLPRAAPIHLHAPTPREGGTDPRTKPAFDPHTRADELMNALVVEDSPQIAERLVELVSVPSRVEVVATAATEDEALAACDRYTISLAIVDLQLAQGLAGPAADQPSHTQLSEREFQIFCKLASGQSVSEIAKELFLSVKTVSTYRSRILEKMNFKSNADITYYAVKNQLIA